MTSLTDLIRATIGTTFKVNGQRIVKTGETETYLTVRKGNREGYLTLQPQPALIFGGNVKLIETAEIA